MQCVLKQGSVFRVDKKTLIEQQLLLWRVDVLST